MKKLLSFLLVLCLAFSLCGCGQEEPTSGMKIYYVATDKNSIVAVPYDFEATTVAGRVREALSMLSTESGEVDYMMTIPYGVEVEEWEINDKSLSLYLTDGYLSLDSFTEVLVRAAIVKTMVQIEGVDSVSIYVDYSPLTDATGSVVGVMTADSFIDDFGEETDSLLNTELTLYFASADGMSVVAETRDVYYSRNVSIEKLIVEQLLKGPETDGLLSAIPDDTKLISISTTNGICYVNFDAGLETAITGITENATVYSIVNSLTELSTVKQVQLLVNGEAAHLSNLDVDLNNPISRNNDVINVPTEETDEYIDGETEDDLATDDQTQDSEDTTDEEVSDVEVTEGE